MNVDKNLIINCKKYNKNSFKQLFKLYEKYLYNLCFNYTQNEQDSLDLVQDIYLKVFNNIQSFDEKYEFHPWIRRISVNACLNFKRSTKNNIFSLNQTIDNNNDILLEDTIESKTNIESDILDLEIKNNIQKCLREIKGNYRIIIILRYYEDLSYNEISEILDKPLGTVKTDLYRAKSILKGKLINLMEEKL